MKYDRDITYANIYALIINIILATLMNHSNKIIIILYLDY